MQLYLEEGMATYSSFLPGESPCTEELSGLYSPWSRKELDMTEQLSICTCKKEHRESRYSLPSSLSGNTKL